MSNQIPEVDRIKNAFAVPDEADKTVLNANNVMLILDKIINGDYVIKLPHWHTADRPDVPEIGMIGINIEIGVLEYYDGVEWRPLGL